jgi:two-component system, sensor histidine kinase and response regulator
MMASMKEQSAAQSDIMIVDDNPANLRLLEDMLLQQGFEARSFPLGRLALAAAARNPPCLILLDINMPEMNGYELCERLRSTAGLSDIPIIFLSALNETQDKIKAFQSGAVDYISKPFQLEEVHARVETHLKLHRLQRAMKLQNERLEEAVAARTRELVDANKRLTILDDSKNEFLTLISHELRTPLNGLLGVGELILDGMPPTKENNELKALFEESRRRILSMLGDALLLAEIDVNGEQFSSAPVPLSAALSTAIARSTEFAVSRDVTLPAPSTDPDLVLGDCGLLVKALHALLETAIKFSQKGQTVQIVRQVSAESVVLLIESHGKTIPSAVISNFFDLFAVGEASTHGGDLGLGPAVASRILSLFGASVSVANRDPSGIRLTLLLKLASHPASLESRAEFLKGSAREFDGFQ